MKDVEYLIMLEFKVTEEKDWAVLLHFLLQGGWLAMRKGPSA